METDIVHAAESAALVGLAIAPRVASDSWAVVLEVGKGGNGWAGAIVFNLWLRRQLRERRMTQRQLAARSGVNHSTISRLLSDNRKPSLDTAAKLVRAVQEIPSDDEVVRYLEALSLSSMLPTRRVEAALRGDEQLEDQDVQALMAAYLAARAKRRRAGDVDSGAERDHEHTA